MDGLRYPGYHNQSHDNTIPVARTGIVVKRSEEEIIEIALKDLERLCEAEIAEIKDADPNSCRYSAPSQRA